MARSCAKILDKRPAARYNKQVKMKLNFKFKLQDMIAASRKSVEVSLFTEPYPSDGYGAMLPFRQGA